MTSTGASILFRDAAHVSLRVGSPGWSRTSDFLINSQALYQLSYRGVSSGADPTPL